MKALILTPEYLSWGGGIATFYRGFLPRLVAEGVGVRVVEGSAFSTAADAAREVRHGVAIERLERSRVQLWHRKFAHLAALPTLRRHLAAAWAMWEQAKEGPEFDVVEACDWGLSFVPPLLAGTHPVVAQCHGSCGQIAAHDSMAGDEASEIAVKFIECGVLASASSLQTYSHANAEFWRAMTARTVEMIRPLWEAQSAAVQLVTLSDRGLVIGRLQRWKGPHVLGAALDRLGERAPTIDWVGRDCAWGTGATLASAHLRAGFPKIWGNKLVHHAPVSPIEVARMQKQARFNVVPSTWDVFNFTVVEAMAAGRPVIVSTGAGASELIEDGVTGFLYPGDDHEALAAVLQRVVSMPAQELARIGAAGAESLRRALDPAPIIARRRQSYEAAQESHRTAPAPRPSAWAIQACTPSEDQANEHAFLSQFPLRMLVAHLGRRFSRRVFDR